MKVLSAMVGVLFLTACAGTALQPAGTTHVVFEGSICGQPAKAKVSDGKERSNFTMRVRCADGSTVVVESGESRAFDGQNLAAQQNQALMGLIEKILPFALGAPLGAAGGAAEAVTP